MAKKDIPFNTIKVMYQLNKILPISSEEASDREIQGEYNTKEQKIDYDISLPIDEKCNTILHEVMHALVYIMGIPFEDEGDEEAVVNSLSSGLITVFKDNPKFITWLANELQKTK